MFLCSLTIVLFALSFALSAVIKDENQQCRKEEFRCRDGSCVPFYGKCDGVVDCPDGSDETYPLCRHFVCQDNLFRCTYGACVDGTAPCNGIQECADNSDELQPQCLNITKIDKYQFICNNGQRIPVTGLCDGERDCPDGTDETIETCAGNTCVSYLMQCAYGACVDAGSKCNGRNDCADGSDESDELCNRTSTATRPSPPLPTPPPLSPNTAISVSSGVCQLPPYPANGQYQVRGRPSDHPGQLFSGVVLVTVTCDPHYAVDGNNSILLLCLQDTDLTSIVPKCTYYCNLPPHRSVEYKCSRKEGKGTLIRPCGIKEFVGTKVMPTCRTPLYRGEPSYMFCEEDGWNYVATCKPDCGKTTPKGKIYIIGGDEAEHAQIPWHAGIYDKNFDPYKQICGGSLISTTAVITAAHCFWKDGEGKRPADNYAVALGKIYPAWDDQRDKDAQFSNVREIHIPDYYHGIETNYQNDIAVVKLETEIEYRIYILPVCISFEYNFNRRQLQNGKTGKVAGWGYTSADGNSSNILKVVDLPYVAHAQCYEESPPDFHQYINSDKICAGFKNGTALCPGDSGGGLAFPEQEQGIRYYLRGVVSIAPNENGAVCDPFQRATFTDLHTHEHFIKEHE